MGLREGLAKAGVGKLLQFFPRAPQGAGVLEADFWSGPIFAFAVFFAVQWWAYKNSDGGGAIVQRMSAAKDEKQSLLATLWFNIAHYALRPWPWILVALASVVVLPVMKDPEAAYPEMIKRFVPPGWMGLVIASFLGAFMSTIDTQLNLSSSFAVNDVYRRFIRKEAGERHYVLVSRLASIGFLLLSCGVALMFDSISGLFKFLLAFGAGVGMVYVLRWFWWRVNAWSEISAMIASSIICGGLYIMGGLAFPDVLMITMAGSTVVWLAVTFLTAPVSAERLVAFYRKVRPYGAWGRIAEKSGMEGTKGLGRQIAAWLGGVVMVLCGTIAPGKFLLGAGVEGWVYAGLALAGTMVVWRFGLREEVEG